MAKEVCGEGLRKERQRSLDAPPPTRHTSVVVGTARVTELSQSSHTLGTPQPWPTEIVDVLVRSGCRHNTPYTGGLNSRNVFLTLLETGKFKIKMLAGSASGKNASWFADGCLLVACSHGFALAQARGGWEEVSGGCTLVSLRRTLILSCPPLTQITSYRPCLQIQSHWG